MHAARRALGRARAAVQTETATGDGGPKTLGGSVPASMTSMTSNLRISTGSLMSPASTQPPVSNCGNSSVSWSLSSRWSPPRPSLTSSLNV